MRDQGQNGNPIDFELIFNSMQNLYAILNPQFQIVAVSDAYLKATMLKREEAIGQFIFDLFPTNHKDTHANGPQILRLSLERVLATKKKDKMGVFRYDILNENKKFIPRIWYTINYPILDKNGKLLYIVNYAEDITQYVKLDSKEKNENFSYQVLNHMEKEELSVIVEFTEDAIISKSLDGIVRSWNKGAERLYGYSAEEMLGRSIGILFSEKNLKEHENIMRDARAGKTVHYLETERLHKNGSIVPVSVSISPIRDENGNIVGACDIAKDITEWKQIQKIKDEFISMVSHELRTPLTSIQGSINLLLGGVVGNLPPQAMRLLDIASNNSDRLIRLINDILDIEKIESGRMDFILKPQSIEEIVKEAIRDNEIFANKYDVKIKLVHKNDVAVNVDHDKIIQVLTNLLSNAIKFATTESTVTVSISKVDSKVRVCISNEGPGIPKEYHHKIFQKFSQINPVDSRRVSGTGLGLNITKQIIEKMNGKIDFTSDRNKETTFYFDLPIYNKPGKAHKTRLLICEDDLDTALYLKTILEAHDCEVLIAEDAKSAKRILDQEKIDALLLDLILPGQDGISLIKELRSSSRFVELPIVVISVKADQGKEELKGMAVNVLDWINKPVSEERLLAMVNKIKTKIQGERPHILHIEDDMTLLQVVATMMEDVAEIVGVTSLERAKEEIRNHKYDLIILDLMLTDGAGNSLLPLISRKHIPVIVFSAYDLPQNYAQYVVKHLTKTLTSTDEFYMAIEAALKEREIKDKEVLYVD